MSLLLIYLPYAKHVIYYTRGKLFLDYSSNDPHDLGILFSLIRVTRVLLGASPNDRFREDSLLTC